MIRHVSTLLLKQANQSSTQSFLRSHLANTSDTSWGISLLSQKPFSSSSSDRVHKLRPRLPWSCWFLTWVRHINPERYLHAVLRFPNSEIWFQIPRMKRGASSFFWRWRASHPPPILVATLFSKPSDGVTYSEETVTVHHLSSIHQIPPQAFTPEQTYYHFSPSGLPANSAQSQLELPSPTRPPSPAINPTLAHLSHHILRPPYSTRLSNPTAIRLKGIHRSQLQVDPFK